MKSKVFALVVCIDIDECETFNGGCEDQCVDHHGSFHCVCNAPGYDVGADNTSCVGKDGMA